MPLLRLPLTRGFMTKVGPLLLPAPAEDALVLKLHPLMELLFLVTCLQHVLPNGPA